MNDLEKARRIITRCCDGGYADTVEETQEMEVARQILSAWLSKNQVLAPDAMRTALERLLAAFKGLQPFPLIVQAVAEGLVHDAEAALSAPVPSPDGADIEDELTGLMDEAWPDGHREMARKILSRFVLSSLGAGAAEPVAAWQWRHRDAHRNAPWSDWRHVDYGVDEFRELWKNQMIGDPAKAAAELRPFYATPPVKGDQEVIARLIEQESHNVSRPRLFKERMVIARLLIDTILKQLK